MACAGARGAEADFKSAGIKPLTADITRAEQLAQLPGAHDWVVNCVSASGGGAEEYREVYLHGMRNLVEWLAAAPPKKFVYTSSTSVYGQNDGSLVKENSSTEPAAETAKVLVATERVLLAAARERKFPAVILRLAGIYGPDRGHWFKQYLKQRGADRRQRRAHPEHDSSRRRGGGDHRGAQEWPARGSL